MILRTQGMRALLSGAVLLFAGSASADKLQQVEIRSAGEAVRIVLHVEGVVTHKSFTLSNPDRLVIDLIGAKNTVQVRTRLVPAGPVKSVRVAQFASTPKFVTRIVADLRSAADYQVQRQGDLLVVLVSPKASKALHSKSVNPLAASKVSSASKSPAPVQARVVADAGSVAKSSEDTVAPVFPVAVASTQKSSKRTSPQKVSVEKESVETSVSTKSSAKPAQETSVKKETVKDEPVMHESAKVAAVSPAIKAVPRVPKSAVVQSSPPAVVKVTETSSTKPVAVVAQPVSSTVDQVRPVQAVPQPASVVSAVPAASLNVGTVRPAPSGASPTPPTSSHSWNTRGYVEDSSPKLQLQPSNRRINLDVQGADIRTVLRTLADYAGMNIIASREVQGEVTASLKDAPWESALEVILRAHGYGYVLENGIIRVGLLERIRNEVLEEAAAARKREDLLPIETRVERMQFANASELRNSLQEMMTNRGRLQVDARTNSLIISDIPSRVELLAQMARELDSRTPQVRIVSKIVDISTEYSKNLGIQWSAANIMSGDVLGSAGVSAPTAGAVGGMRLGTVQSWGQLNLMIDALASAKKANIISNPTITTVNNREAKILVGSKIPLIVADEAGNAITQLTTIGISMRVTPHVNSDNTITLDLHPEISELSAKATVQGGVIINTSEADTRVIVQDGETAIIGGLIRNVQSEVKTGIPVLQDLPLIGWLFRNSNVTNDKREMIIFVTPTLVK